MDGFMPMPITAKKVGSMDFSRWRGSPNIKKRTKMCLQLSKGNKFGGATRWGMGKK